MANTCSKPAATPINMLTVPFMNIQSSSVLIVRYSVIMAVWLYLRFGLVWRPIFGDRGIVLKSTGYLLGVVSFSGDCF